MKYKECPLCGAHLDYGERCDCQENKKEDAPDAPGTSTYGIDIFADVSVSNSWPNVNHCLRLREIRQDTGAMAKDAAMVVRNVFPKFNRQLLAQCENWKNYGVIIHPDGLSAICEAYGLSVKSNPVPIPDPIKAPRKKANRKLGHKLTFRMTESDFEKMERRVHQDGFLSVQAWMYFQFTKLLGDET